MELILHIGISKTGTTAIQEFLWKNRMYFLKNFKMLYPKAGIDFGKGHHRLAFALRKVGYNTKKIISDIYQCIQLKKPNIVLISSEELFPLENPLILKDFIKIFVKIYITIYLRRQDLWIESIYAETVKNTMSKNMEFFPSWINKTPHKVWSNFYHILKNWQNAFPEAKIIPRIYDKKLLPNGNVILDFLSIIGIDNYPEEKIKLEANPSLSHISVLVTRKINENFSFPIEIHRELVKFLIDVDKKHKHPLKTFFTLRERIEFLERFGESNEKLFREWFNSENKFVLSEEEIEFYKQQDEILKDKEKLEKDINERYEQVLEFLKQIEPNFEKYKKENIAKIHVPVSKKTDVYGYVDIMNNNKITGWVLDLEENKPTDVILRINEIQVIEKKANIERKDIKNKLDIDINTGFDIHWKEVVLPEEIKNLPNNTVCNVEVFHKRTNKLIQGNYKTYTVGELKKLARVSKEFPWIKYTLSDEVKELIEFINVDQLYIDVLREGRLIIGGLVVLKENFSMKDYKLVVKDKEGIKEVKWGLPSPGYAQKNIENPNAKTARFRIDNVLILNGNSGELFLMHKEDNHKLKILEIIV